MPGKHIITILGRIKDYQKLASNIYLSGNEDWHVSVINQNKDPESTDTMSQ